MDTPKVRYVAYLDKSWQWRYSPYSISVERADRLLRRAGNHTTPVAIWGIVSEDEAKKITQANQERSLIIGKELEEKARKESREKDYGLKQGSDYGPNRQIAKSKNRIPRDADADGSWGNLVKALEA